MKTRAAPSRRALYPPEPKKRVVIPVSLGQLCLRHTAATELLEEGHRIETVQRRLGHKDIRTTMGYAEVSAARVRAELEGGPRH